MEQKNKLMRDIYRRFQELTYHIENNDHNEERFLTQEIGKEAGLEDVGLSLTEYHMIACIGDNGSANGTTVSKALNITKGGVSKNAVKLIDKGLIQTIRLPHNKKEVHYTLTEVGERIYRIHDNMHTMVEENLTERLSSYTLEELEVIRRFLIDFDSGGGTSRPPSISPLL